MQQFIEDEPPVYRGDEFYLRAFWELCSERQFGKYMGPIPWSKIVLYGERRNLAYPMNGVFEVVIRNLDEAYLDWQRTRQQRQIDQQQKASQKK